MCASLRYDRRKNLSIEINTLRINVIPIKRIRFLYFICRAVIKMLFYMLGWLYYILVHQRTYDCLLFDEHNFLYIPQHLAKDGNEDDWQICLLFSLLSVRLWVINLHLYIWYGVFLFAHLPVYAFPKALHVSMLSKDSHVFSVLLLDDVWRMVHELEVLKSISLFEEYFLTSHDKRDRHVFSLFFLWRYYISLCVVV